MIKKISKSKAPRGQLCWMCNRKIAVNGECMEVEAVGEQGIRWTTRFHLACSITFSEETLSIMVNLLDLPVDNTLHNPPHVGEKEK